MRFLTIAIVLFSSSFALAAQQKEFDVPGPIELHIYLTAKPGQNQELERVYREQFYPAIRHQPGFVSSELMRKPNGSDYVLRLTFKSEELRLKWVATPEHKRAWPMLDALSSKTSWQGFGVIYPPR